MEDLAGKFLDEIKTFMASRGLNKSEFGKAALKDPAFVGDLENGRSPSLKTISRVRRFMSASPSNGDAA